MARALGGYTKTQVYPVSFCIKYSSSFGKIPSPSLLFLPLMLVFFEHGSWLHEGRESFSEACHRQLLLFSSTSSPKTSELFVIIFCSEKPVLSCSIEGETEVPGGDSLLVAGQVRRRAVNRLPETCLLALKQEKDWSCGRVMTAEWMEKGKN